MKTKSGAGVRLPAPLKTDCAMDILTRVETQEVQLLEVSAPAPSLWAPSADERALLQLVINDFDAATNVLPNIPEGVFGDLTARRIWRACRAVWGDAATYAALTPVALISYCQTRVAASEFGAECANWRELEAIVELELATLPTLPNGTGDAMKDALALSKRMSAAPAFRDTKLSEVRVRPSPIWLIQGILVETTAVVLSGDSQSFKTFSALDMAFCVATGTAWHGRAVKSGTVVYIAAEGGWTLRDRLEAWETRRGVRVSDEQFCLLEMPVSIGDVGTVAAFAGFIQSRAPRLVVIDTLSACAEGLKENASEDMATFIRNMKAIARATGAAVAVIHHNNKGGDLRGAVSLKNDADTHLTFERAGEESDLITIISCSKHRGPHFAKFALRGEEIALSEPNEYGDVVTSLVFDRCELPETSGRVHPNSKKGEETFDRLLELFDSLALEYNGAGVRAGTWKAKAEEQGICSGGAFWRALKKAAPDDGSGLIQKEGDFYRRIKATPTTPTTPNGSCGSEGTSPVKTTPTTPITPLGVGVVGVGSVSVKSGSSAKSKKGRAAAESEPYRATANGS